jgi:hypothetical protein
MELFFFFFLQHYGPFSLALPSLTIDAHSTLSNAFVLHRFTPSFLKSSSTSFIHLSLGRPYFVCVVVFLNLSGIFYMVSEQLTFLGMGLSALCPTPSYPEGPMFSVGVVGMELYLHEFLTSAFRWVVYFVLPASIENKILG